MEGPAIDAPSDPPPAAHRPPLVKICGLTSVEEALAAADRGAYWIGLNFYPKSPRRVDLDTARRIVDALPDSCEPVGLFVDRPAVEIAALAEWLEIDVIQLHGCEPFEELPYLAGFRVVKAFRLASGADIEVMRVYAQGASDSGHPLHAVLADASVPGQFGGTGRSIADDLLGLLADAAPGLPRLILAGGLTPENVADRVRRVRPWMVDVAGGVESSPGRKDAARVGAFVREARDS